jgi:PTS system nitrogen regulatory IIA component
MKISDFLSSTDVTADFAAFDKQQVIAIPHARFHQINKPFGLLVRLRKPIDFDAVDGKPVDIVFLLLLPNRQDSQGLAALACVARKLREPAITAALRSAPDGEELYHALVAN